MNEYNFKNLTKLYLDIDGVLLTAKQTKIADFASPFIEFVTNNFECFWLTTHCKGEVNTTINYLQKYFDDRTMQQLTKVKPTDWKTLKTEAIDFSSDFFWLEDNPFQSEIKILYDNFNFDKLIIIDLNKPTELQRVQQILMNSQIKKHDSDRFAKE